MATIATLAVKLLADASAFVKTMDQAQQKTETWSKAVSKNVMKVGQDITNVGKGMTAYMTLPLLAAGSAAVQMASDLEETKNKVNVVFAEMAEDVMAWSRTSDVALGLSQQRALDAVGTFGAMGQAAGLNADQNLKWSQSLVKLSSDWASFYNLDPAESLQIIQSAVAGQYEPLRRLGIVLNQATLEQKAMQMGLMEQGGALSEAARMQVIYALMVERSSAAQGDFARTADGAANMARIVRAQFENAAATLGQQLLPYATQLLQWVSQAITWFQALNPEQQKWIVILAGILAVVGPLLIVVGSLVTAIGAIIPVVTAVGTALLPFAPWILGILAVLALLYVAWDQNWFGIREKTGAAIEFIRGVIAGGMQFIQDLTSGKLGWMSQMWQNTMDAIGGIIENALAIWRHIKQAWMNLMRGNWYMFGKEMRLIWEAGMRILGIFLGAAWENIKLLFANALKKIIDHFKTINWAEVGINILKGIGIGLLGAIPMLISIVKTVGSAVMDAFKGFFSIKSPSIKMEREIGWQLAAGQARGYERGVNAMMPTALTGPNMPSTPQPAGAAGMLGGGNGGVILHVDYRPWLSTADRNEVMFQLGPALEEWTRGYGKKDQ